MKTVAKKLMGSLYRHTGEVLGSASIATSLYLGALATNHEALARQAHDGAARYEADAERETNPGLALGSFDMAHQIRQGGYVEHEAAVQASSYELPLFLAGLSLLGAQAAVDSQKRRAASSQVIIKFDVRVQAERMLAPEATTVAKDLVA